MPTEMIRIETLDPNERRLLRSVSPEERKMILVAAAIEKLQRGGDFVIDTTYEDQQTQEEEPNRPSVLILRRMEELPNDQQNILISRVEERAREMYETGMPRNETFQACLTFAYNILEELRHTHRPVPNLLTPEKLITRALVKAMGVYPKPTE